MDVGGRVGLKALESGGARQGGEAGRDGGGDAGPVFEVVAGQLGGLGVADG